MKFIDVTRHDGQHVVVNADRIDTVVQYEGFTSIGIGATTLDVKESIRDIFRQIES